MKKYLKIIAIVIIAFISFYIDSSNAKAINSFDENKDISFTINYKYQKNALKDAFFDIYKIADIDNNYNLYIKEEFSQYPIELKKLDHDKRNDYALTLKSYVIKDNLKPIINGKTNLKGVLNINLKSGLYLVIPNELIIDNYKYKANPYFVCFPKLDKNTGLRKYKLSSNPKIVRDDIEKTTIDKKVLKIRNDTGYEKMRPQNIEVELLANGKTHEIITLDKSNNWRHIRQNLEPTTEWMVVERIMRDNKYEVKISESDNTFIIENSFIRKDEDDKKIPGIPNDNKDKILPQTGQEWNIVYILVALGIVFILIGFLKEKIKYKNDH